MVSTKEGKVRQTVRETKREIGLNRGNRQETERRRTKTEILWNVQLLQDTIICTLHN